MEFSEEEINAAKAKAGKRELHLIEVSDDFAVIVMPPSRGEYLKFLADTGKGDDLVSRFQSAESMVLASTVYPEREKLKEKLNEKSGYVLQIAGELTTLAGAGATTTVKKL